MPLIDASSRMPALNPAITQVGAGPEHIAANKTPTLYDSTSTKAFLQAHKNQRNAILNLSSDDPFSTPRHSIHLILAGQREHDSEVKLLQNEFNEKNVTVLRIEELYTEVLTLECASASAAGAHPRFKARRQGERPARRIFHQPPGNPKLKYNCWLCRPTDQDSNVESKECLAFFRMLVF
jgi:hypothetical protein